MDARFRHHWDEWRRRLRQGQSPADFLSTCSDETLVELLADGHDGSQTERNVIATELTNRISRLHRAVGAHAGRVRGLLDENEEHRAAAESKARAASTSAQHAASEMQKAGESDRAIREETDALEGNTEKTSRYAPGKERERGW